MAQNKIIEKLMQKRYKLINDYPGNELPVGSIIKFDVESVWVTHNGELVTAGKMIAGLFSSYYYSHVLKIEDYQHLFQKLEWWEEREIEEMPEYVKVQNNGAVRRVVEHFHLRLFNACCIVENPQGKHKLFYSKLEPATIEDYTHYINQKQNK